MSIVAVVAKSKMMKPEEEKLLDLNLTEEELAIFKQESIVPTEEVTNVLKTQWEDKTLTEKNADFNALMWLVMNGVFITKPHKNEVSEFHWHRNMGLLGNVYSIWTFNKDVNTLNSVYDKFGVQGLMAYFSVKDKETGLDKLNVFYPAPYLATEKYDNALKFLGFNPQEVKSSGYRDELFCSGYGDISEDTMKQVLVLNNKGLLFNKPFHESKQMDDNGWHLFVRISEIENQEEFTITMNLEDLPKIVDLVESYNFEGLLAWVMYTKNISMANASHKILSIVEVIKEREDTSSWFKQEHTED